MPAPGRTQRSYCLRGARATALRSSVVAGAAAPGGVRPASADVLRTEEDASALGRRQMTVQPRVDPPEDEDDAERAEDEVGAGDRVGDEGVEGLFGEIAGVVERVPLLAPGREAGEEHQRRGVKEKDRLVRVA